jgi:diguanylate cyclase (GGDEF)-like protein
MQPSRSPVLNRPVAALVTAIGLLGLLFAALGALKPLAEWSVVDIAGEGGLALLATAWAGVVLCSRPGGRVTALLGWGLSALALAAWADALDEFFRPPHSAAWLGWIESCLAPLGMVVLSFGLVLWRQEQQVLAEQLGAREGGQRDHRRFDRLTQLADAAYLRDEMARLLATGQAVASVVMLELPERGGLERQHGLRAGMRLMQAVSQQLLLNLRPGDLLCRYAGDRLVVLMPDTPPAQAARRAAHLQHMVEAMQVHVGAAVLPIRVQVACAELQGDAQRTLSALGAQLHLPELVAT